MPASTPLRQCESETRRCAYGATKKYVTDQPTDQPTDRPTDGRTQPLMRRTHLIKMKISHMPFNVAVLKHTNNPVLLSVGALNYRCPAQGRALKKTVLYSVVWAHQISLYQGFRGCRVGPHLCFLCTLKA